MSPALNGSSALQHFEHGNVVEVSKYANGIMFNFYLGLSHVKSFQVFLPIFLQGCKTKSGTKSLGLRPPLIPYPSSSLVSQERVVRRFVNKAHTSDIHT